MSIENLCLVLFHCLVRFYAAQSYWLVPTISSYLGVAASVRALCARLVEDYTPPADVSLPSATTGNITLFDATTGNLTPWDDIHDPVSRFAQQCDIFALPLFALLCLLLCFKIASILMLLCERRWRRRQEEMYRCMYAAVMVELKSKHGFRAREDEIQELQRRANRQRGVNAATTRALFSNGE